jgi:hypothetical protein
MIGLAGIPFVECPHLPEQHGVFEAGGNDPERLRCGARTTVLHGVSGDWSCGRTSHRKEVAGGVMQYLKSRFTVTGEGSKKALENYEKGYVQIDWSDKGSGETKKAK